MKVLVYGVGAVGALTVHLLCKAGNDVTVVARSTYEQLKEKGLVIEHRIQKKTTVDHPNVVKEADPSEYYDIVFSIMQSQQQISLLDTLSKLNTKLIVLIGNNIESEKCESYLQKHKVSERSILFGFQSSCGHREEGKAVCANFSKVSLYIGGLHSAPKPEDLNLVKKAFNPKDLKFHELDDMHAFYMYHVAGIMPLVYLNYKYDCNFKKATSNDIKMVLKASKEFIDYMKANDIKPMPPNEDTYYESGFKYHMLHGIYRILSKTSLGELTVSDHCKNAVSEMKYIDEKIEDYRKNTSSNDMPTWDTMRKWAEKVINKN